MKTPIEFNMNKFYMLASVNGSHMQSAKDLYDYHIGFKDKEMVEVDGRDDLFGALERIAGEVDGDSGPLIHIEAHGLDSRDGLTLSKGIELSNGEQVYWKELRPYFTTINAKCGNNLSLVMATCFGMYVLDDLIRSFWEDLDAQCPFFCFVGPELGISVDDFITALPKFYEKLQAKSSLHDAVKYMNNYSNVKFRYDTAFIAFKASIDSFADKQIKNRVRNMSNNPDLLSSYYCGLYHYTYGKDCDMEAVSRIMTDEQFYIDYINKRRSRFLHIKEGEDDRFPMIGKIENFERTVPTIRGIN